MRIIKASEDIKFQISPRGFISPTFYVFNYRNKVEFITNVKEKIEEFPYLLCFDGGESLLHLDDNESKQLFFSCLESYYDDFAESDYEKTFNDIIKLLYKFNPNLREKVIKELSNYKFK